MCAVHAHSTVEQSMYIYIDGRRYKYFKRILFLFIHIMVLVLVDIVYVQRTWYGTQH